MIHFLLFLSTKLMSCSRGAWLYHEEPCNFLCTVLTDCLFPVTERLQWCEPTAGCTTITPSSPSCNTVWPTTPTLPLAWLLRITSSRRHTRRHHQSPPTTTRCRLHSWPLHPTSTLRYQKLSCKLKTIWDNLPRYSSKRFFHDKNPTSHTTLKGPHVHFHNRILMTLLPNFTNDTWWPFYQLSHTTLKGPPGHFHNRLLMTLLPTFTNDCLWPSQLPSQTDRKSVV